MDLSNSGVLMIKVHHCVYRCVGLPLTKYCCFVASFEATEVIQFSNLHHALVDTPLSSTYCCTMAHTDLSYYVPPCSLVHRPLPLSMHTE